MSLINCPECGNECSSSAASCPQCGHPFVKPVVQPKVVVREVSRKESFPKWIFIPLALLGLVILFVVFVALRRDDEPNQKNLNVNIASARQLERNQTPSSVTSSSQPSTVTVPSTSQPSTVVVPPNQEVPSTVTSVPSTTTSSTITAPTPLDKGSIALEAKIATRSGNAMPAQRVRFYLLDKDLDSILNEAKINDELGQGAVNAFALSVVNPNKYREANQKGFAAIKRHIVYSTMTDASGKAQIKDVKPDNYYLFAISTTKNGFALWNAPIVISNGPNSLMLEPATPTEIIDNNQ